MVLDVTIILIMAGFAIYGFKKGFAFTAIHTGGWLLSLGGAYLGVTPLSDFIRKNTEFYDYIFDGFKERFASGDIGADSSLAQLPELLSMDLEVDDITTAATDAMARMFADLTFTLIIFVGLFVTIKLITWILLRAFSNDHKDGFASFFDGFMGAIFSMVKGAILICIILALFMPLADFLAPDMADAFARDLDMSSFTKDIYENNPLLLIPKKLFGSMF